MDEREMNAALVRAMGMIAKRVRGDADLAADALVRVWIRLQQPGQYVSWLLVRRAIWDVRHDVALPGMRQMGASYDPYRHQKHTSLYRDTASRPSDPAVIVERMEGVGIIARLAHNETERCWVDGKLDGSTDKEIARMARRSVSALGTHKRRLKARCRKVYPSLIGY